MDYLGQHALASVPALRATCHYLKRLDRDAPLEEVSTALQPAPVVEAADAGLRASTAVGQDIGLLQSSGRGANATWSVTDVVREAEDRVTSNASDFRPFVLRALTDRALAGAANDEKPADLLLGLAWLLTLDPTLPLSSNWNQGPENAVDSAGLRESAIANAEQWRAFTRWVRALGLATVTSTSGRQEVVTPDPTTAVIDVLDELPEQAPANEFCRRLLETVPVIDSAALRAKLPAGALSSSTQSVSAPLALAFYKLERMQILQLTRTDDATRGVALTLGGRTSVIGQVQVKRNPE